MNERLEIFLESSTVAWDNFYRGASKPMQIFCFVDSRGGVWDIANRVAPCGGELESQSNPFRNYWFCKRHPEEGVLINSNRDNGFYWMSGKEVEKK